MATFETNIQIFPGESLSTGQISKRRAIKNINISCHYFKYKLKIKRFFKRSIDSIRCAIKQVDLTKI